MKKLLATLAVAGLTVAGAGSALANTKYTSPCGTSVKNRTSQPTVDAPSGTGSGHVGVRGANGYLEAEGNAATQSGTIDGKGEGPNGHSIYGSVGGSPSSGPQICVGSSVTGTHRLP